MTEGKITPCSTPTPTNNDSDDADADIHIAKQPMFPHFLVVESTNPQKKLPGLNDVILDRSIQGVTSVSACIEWMCLALLIEVSHEAYAGNLQTFKAVMIEPTCEGRLICPEEHVSSLNKWNAMVRYFKGSDRGLSLALILV